ncbi:putative bifunctional chitinase/lysozyme [Streptomyces hundungensis]|uniref:Putative bifunctional chitinase/lysozyme n=1 Tax=Streptomyces hundungensis TaxID=1077946 RepID=A0A387HEW9_9ACTN|nr:chitinase [Streptomyces hundungensis]AYG81171.1 putative bifunctional chitinase/lysozyme [Streptomyces hundungensis]
MRGFLSFLRVPVVGAGVLAALLCAGCSSTPDAPGDPDGTAGAAGAAKEPAPAALTSAYSPYVSATTAAPTDAVGSPAVYNLAFAVAHGSTCRAVWDDETAIADRDVKDRAAALKKSGAAVRVSFGGQAGKELALTCRTPAQLAAAYRSALDAVGSAEADFDIEGAALTDPAALTRRAEAIALLQKERALKVTFTLAVMPTGLTPQALALLKSAEEHGVKISTVNIMTMNYGTSFGGNMGDYAVRAATAAHAQLQALLGLSDRAAWQALGVTSMVGVNDVKGETFTLEDAAVVRAFARGKGVGRVSMWVTYRDQACASGVNSGVAQPSCSGVPQTPGAFAKALSRP